MSRHVSMDLSSAHVRKISVFVICVCVCEVKLRQLP